MWISDGIHDNPFHIRWSSPPCFLLQERPPCLIKTPAGNWKIDFFHRISFKASWPVSWSLYSPVVSVVQEPSSHQLSREFGQCYDVRWKLRISRTANGWNNNDNVGGFTFLNTSFPHRERGPNQHRTTTTTIRRRGRKLEFITVKVAIDWPLDSVYTYSYHNPSYVTSSSSVLVLNCL